MLQNESGGCFDRYFKGIWKDRYILLSLTRSDLKMKYHRSFLGVAWSVITPLGLSIIIGCVYAVIYDISPTGFIPLLFAGLNPWLFINGCADGGTAAYTSAEGYIKQIAIHPQIFPIRCVLVSFVNFLYSLIAFFIMYVFVNPGAFCVRMFMIIPAMIIAFTAAVGLANLVSLVTVYVRDFPPLQRLVLQGLFYVTPIIYTTEMLDSRGFSIIYKVNPLYYFIDILRSSAMGDAPNGLNYLVASIVALTLWAISVVITMHHEKKIVMGL